MRYVSIIGILLICQTAVARDTNTETSRAFEIIETFCSHHADTNSYKECVELTGFFSLMLACLSVHKADDEARLECFDDRTIGAYLAIRDNDQLTIPKLDY